jgi:hypothetical protein
VAQDATRSQGKLLAAHKLTAAGLRHFTVREVSRDRDEEMVFVVLVTALPKPRDAVRCTCRLRRGRLISLKVDG